MNDATLPASVDREKPGTLTAVLSDMGRSLFFARPAALVGVHSLVPEPVDDLRRRTAAVELSSRREAQQVLSRVAPLLAPVGEVVGDRGGHGDGGKVALRVGRPARLLDPVA